MTQDIHIRQIGSTGRITLTRPKALNALSYDMATAMDQALIDWAENDTITQIVIDAEGDKAFCAGGDIQQLYDTGKAGDFAYGQQFWRDEYRLNARIAAFPKPILSFLQGFVMGGGVGVGCHAAHRVVDDASQIAMPECGIGLVPDVGGSLLLARAPGRLGEYLGLTAARMGPADAIYAGFADHYIPRLRWNDMISNAEKWFDISDFEGKAHADQPAPLAATQSEIDALFTGDLAQIVRNLEAAGTELASGALKAIRRNSPLSMACTLRMLDQLRRENADMRAALTLEYRFTARAMEHGDFLEGIRAQIIDRDRNPTWKHALMAVPQDAIDHMLAPLGAEDLTFGED